ncbi:MAG: Gfo/Idh/MocA family oxidoreductase [Verrucomicrobiae bacterium]|nr:Gfo/Idh/MocA family oxidoreductase [Verrucomicrobiae bacterium]
MKDKVKIALVGTGEIGRVHAKAYSEVEGVELCIAAMIQPEVEKQLSEQYGARLYPNFEAALADSTLDAVDICLPNDLHREFTVRALQAGKHVLCEKPIALTLEDADAMIAAARSAGRFLMIGHVWRFWPEVRKAKEALDAGVGGEPLAISARRMVSLLAGTRGDRDWRHKPERSGGAVIDMQIHDLDMFCWFYGGRPVSVFSQGLRSADGALNHVFTHLNFPGGRQAFVEASFMMKGNPLDIFFRVLGTERSIEYGFNPESFALHQLEGKKGAKPAASLVLYEWKREPVALHVPQEDSFAVAFRDEVGYFAQCVSEGVPPAIGTGEQARLALEVALASRRSCETGQPVSLS